jgi:DNA-binding HxlR family transcriptional regulator
MKRLSDYAPKIDELNQECPVRAAIDVIQGRWKPSILCVLKDGTRRFTEVQERVPGVTAQALTVQLRQLELAGVVARTVYPEVPARVEYALTDHGRALSDVMDRLEAWGTEHLQRRDANGRVVTKCE